MMLSVEAILKKRHNEKAANCVRKKCGGVESIEIAPKTNMLFCKVHGWKEMIAGNH